MIATLSGVLRSKAPDEIVVECGGVGYGVTVPMSTYGALPESGLSVSLLVHTHVREDALQLYGFTTPVEKVLFKLLITISGIGPRMAVSIMSGLATGELLVAIQARDAKRLTLVPGIGKKTAERIVLELSDKVRDLAPVLVGEEMAQRAPVRRPVQEDVISALVNLGYRTQAAEEAVRKATERGVAEFEQVLRESLRLLAPSG